MLLPHTTAMLWVLAIVLSCVVVLALRRRPGIAPRFGAGAALAGEKYFRTVAEALPGILWTAHPDGALDFTNTRWHEYTGLTREGTTGSGWQAALHPDDLALTRAKWEHSVRTGDPFELEYRFRRASDGTYRWFLGQANPIRDGGGGIIKWFGTCIDIEDQKHNQQILEDQIRDRTVELADANTRLQEEMLQKDLSQREFDRQNTRMMQELTDRSQRATLLAKMGELLQSCMSKEEVFSAALGFAPRIFPMTRGAVALLNSARTLVEVIGSWSECALPATVFEPSSCWALRTGHLHLVVAADQTARCTHAAGVENTYLCIPILAQGEALGVLHVQTTAEMPVLGEVELSFKTTFAEQVGLSISNLRLPGSVAHPVDPRPADWSLQPALS